MQKTVTTEWLNKALVEGFPEDIDSPVIQKDGVSLIRYDKIELQNMTDAIGGVKVSFFFGGRMTHWIRVEGISFSSESVLTLSGISGDQSFSLR